MDQEKKIKKIRRIAKGEKVILQMLPEDLQDRFDKMEEVNDEGQRIFEADREEKTDASAKNLHFATLNYLKARFDFWGAFHERFGFWKESLGVRDGYTVVMCAKKEHPFKRFLKEMRDEFNPDGTGNGFQIEE